MGNVSLKQKIQKGGGQKINITCINHGLVGCISDISKVLSKLRKFSDYIHIHNVSSIHQLEDLIIGGQEVQTNDIISKWIGEGNGMGFKIMKAPPSLSPSPPQKNKQKMDKFHEVVLDEIKNIQIIPDKALRYTSIKKNLNMHID